jgi:predicted transposase YbfD/YdcC
MVSAWAAKNQITLGQVQTYEKSNEINAIPELLNLLEIKGCIVTIDAMECQKKMLIRSLIREQIMFWLLKKIRVICTRMSNFFFEDAQERNFDDIAVNYFENVDGDHGRVEIRRYWTVSQIDWLHEKEKWKNLNIIAMAQL